MKFRDFHTALMKKHDCSDESILSMQRQMIAMGLDMEVEVPKEMQERLTQFIGILSQDPELQRKVHDHLEPIMAARAANN